MQLADPLRSVLDDRSLHKRGSYRPKLPWLGLLAGLALVGTLVGVYMWQQRVDRERHLQRLKGLDAREIDPVRSRYHRFERSLLRRVGRAQKALRHADAIAPGFRWAELRQQSVAYLHLPAGTSRQTPVSLRELVQQSVQTDAIPRCLGLVAEPLTRLPLLASEVLKPLESRLRGGDGVMRLRVLRDELSRVVRRDLPRLQAVMAADATLVVIENEVPATTAVPAARPNAVRRSASFWLWGPEEQLRFHVRVDTSNQRVLQAKLGAARTTATSSSQQRALQQVAADCSVASALRQRLQAASQVR